MDLGGGSAAGDFERSEFAVVAVTNWQVSGT